MVQDEETGPVTRREPAAAAALSGVRARLGRAELYARAEATAQLATALSFATKIEEEGLVAPDVLAALPYLVDARNLARTRSEELYEQARGLDEAEGAPSSERRRSR